MLFKKHEVNPKVHGPRAWFVNSAHSIFPRATNTQILHARDFLKFLPSQVLFQIFIYNRFFFLPQRCNVMLIFKTFFSPALAL